MPKTVSEQDSIIIDSLFTNNLQIDSGIQRL
jgi:hypothetical protein